jgi:hypothetical protein
LAVAREIKRMGLPAVPLALQRDLYDYLQAVKNWIMWRSGEMRNDLDSRYVTKAEYDALEKRVTDLENL